MNDVTEAQCKFQVLQNCNIDSVAKVEVELLFPHYGAAWLRRFCPSHKKWASPRRDPQFVRRMHMLTDMHMCSDMHVHVYMHVHINKSTLTYTFFSLCHVHISQVSRAPCLGFVLRVSFYRSGDNSCSQVLIFKEKELFKG